MNDREFVSLRCSAAVFRGESVLLCRRLDDAEPTWILPGGTPRQGEGAASCVRREVLEETGLEVDPDRVAFVLETTSPNLDHHLTEIVFLALTRDARVEPAAREAHLQPEFVDLKEVGSLKLLPPIAGYLRGISREQGSLGGSWPGTAAYLGNVWRPDGASLGAPEQNS